MDPRDKLSTFLSCLRGWFKLPAIAIGIMLTTVVAQGAIIFSEPLDATDSTSAVDVTSDVEGLKINVEHRYINDWLNNLRESKADCQSYVSVMNWFNTCKNDTLQSDIEEVAPEQNSSSNPPDAEHTS